MSDSRGIQFLKSISRQFKAFLFSKDALSFLFFLFLSAGFWFVHAVNKDRESSITVPVRYSSLPEDLVIVNLPPQEIRVNIKDEGLNLFAYSKRRLSPLTFDLSQAALNKGNITISSGQIHERLSHHLSPTTLILSFSPDSILVQYEKQESVWLPVKLHADIELAQQYIFSDSIQIIPARVRAYGSKEKLSALKEVQTEYLNLPQLKDSTAVSCRIMPVSGVRFSADTVSVRINTEMFTEKKIQLPVAAVNFPKNLSVKLFPAVVDVTYNIGLSHYNTKFDDVQVILDYEDIKKNQQEKQRLKVKNVSPKIFNIRVAPEEIEFLLKEEN